MAAFVDEAIFEARESLLHGRGLFAKRNISMNTKIFRERPLVAMQTLSNRHDSLVCSCCFGPLPTDPAIHLEVLAGTREPLQLADDPDAYGLVGCSQKCGELYCSKNCRDMAFGSSHCLLCVGLVDESEAEAHPLMRFKVHAASTNEIFLLVGVVVATMVRRHESAEAAGRDFTDYAHLPFASFVQNLWWDVVVAPPGSDVSR
jgi:hypothetical protein